jgi:lipid A 3-O-deacylase
MENRTSRAMTNIKKLLALSVAALTAFRTSAATDINEDGFAVEKIFRANQWEISLSAGPLFSPFIATKHRSTVNYVVGGFQFGWMISDLNSAGPLRGNWEMVSEVFGAPIYEGKGTYIAGSTLWFRYNFVPASWCVVPYAQGGGGFVFTDTDNRLLGQRFNFNLDLAFGLRFFVSERCSLNAEYRYQHISNADLASNNVGINAHGPMLGASYFF